MARRESIQVDIPIETFEKLRDEILSDIGKREFTRQRSSDGTFASNGPVGEHILQVLIGNESNLSERWADGAELQPSDDGMLEIVRDRDANGNFTSQED
ncbi:hypothetical protein SG26_02695 [Haloarcula sp. CBA1115]|nr:hypothetical protein SG26_02695 [Haloarcula sp. CBA1115]